LARSRPLGNLRDRCVGEPDGDRAESHRQPELLPAPGQERHGHGSRGHQHQHQGVWWPWPTELPCRSGAQIQQPRHRRGAGKPQDHHVAQVIDGAEPDAQVLESPARTTATPMASSKPRRNTAPSNASRNANPWSA
jgi:hypothetical protein